MPFRMNNRLDSRSALTELSEARLLPRLDAPTVRALNRLYRAAEPLPVTLAAQDCLLRWQLFAPTGLELEGFDLYSFTLGTANGHLGLDPLATEWALTERRAALLPRELRCVLLADALAPLVRRLEQATHLRFEWTLPEAPNEAPRFDPLRAACFDIEVPLDTPLHGGGYLAFDDAAMLDTLSAALCGPAQPGLPIDWLRVPLSFELGRTPIRLHEISGIRPGDIISIEQWRPAGSAICAALVLGHGHVTSLTALADDTRIALQPWKDFIVNTPGTAASTSADNASSISLERLDSLEVTLRFEVGDLSLSVRELRGIRPGHVFELAEPLNRSTVRIVAHGNTLGTGHLVAVGDRLGVRVVEFAPDVHEG
jgi:type III secretion protein Q